MLVGSSQGRYISIMVPITKSVTIRVPKAYHFHESIESFEVRQQIHHFSMSAEERKVLTKLANNYDDEDEVLGIFKTNAMIISPTESALFPWVCRANHSCVPNCNYIFNQQLGHQQLYCSRFITVGEELTVSYLPDNIVGGVEERRKFLTENHNFICMCECCSLEPGVALKQDEYFRQIAVRRIGKFVGEVVNFYDVYFADDINILAKEIPLDLGDSKLKSKYKYSCLNLLSQLQKM